MILKYLLLFLIISTLGSFIWGLLKFFAPSSTSTSDIRIQLIKLFGMVNILLTPVLAIRGDFDISSMAAAFVIYTGSLILFWLAIRTHRSTPPLIAFSKEAPKSFQDRGPYRLVRHPFYTSYMLAWIGGIVLTKNLLLVVPTTVLFYLYYSAAKLEESQFNSSMFQKDYQSYRDRTGMFFPKI